MKRFSLWLALVFSGLVFFPGAGSAQAPYYAGKTITVIEGNSPGGTADLRTKTIVSILQKYIPGNPTILTQYVPGAGGRQAASQVYRAAPDGLTIGATSPGVLSSAVLGATSFTQASSARSSFRRPRGHKRSTRIRRPSPRAGGS